MNFIDNNDLNIHSTVIKFADNTNLMAMVDSAG